MRIIFAAALLVFGLSAAQAGNECSDGTYSQSSGSGTCSHHGGEAKNR